MGYLNKKYQLVHSRNHYESDLRLSEELRLVKLFDRVFDLENICRSATLIDLHSYRVYNGGGRVKKALTRRDKLPFYFIVYNN